MILRCLRCARFVEATSTDDVKSLGMLKIGYNLYYCEQYAKMVGFKESMYLFHIWHLRKMNY
jgi:hypothetical protein